MLYLSCEKHENKQKEAGFGPFKKYLISKFEPKNVRRSSNEKWIKRRGIFFDKERGPFLKNFIQRLERG